ncbi:MULTISPECIES: M48 family metalloprotease [unclassified Novosphingobium]|uniref:M48 family metalloprotease n=1 Tax=unclassified Novosphingobium TaxID=2644732 RepID=UPI0025E2AF03|nr:MULTISPECIES: M48 family metalloprotease [unclassified Novosphingobium]HQV02930.1 M48 family metalloprotease [Novosphingobium sp.]
MSAHLLANRRTLAFILGTGLILPVYGAGQSAPANAQSSAGTVQAISAKDKQEGAKYHPQLVAEFGGAVSGPQALYVESVGKKIAVQSGLSNAQGDFTVTLLNSSVDNAFAIPGGYIYTTRQLVSLMNNEAELAGVLGHEVGHVAARHSNKRQSAATRNQVIGVLGAVLSGVFLGNSQFGQLLQQGFLQGSQILTLKFSRSQENEADKLGIEYLRRAGYDPRAMSTVLASLAAQNTLSVRLLGAPDNRAPEWASTHPDPAKRVSATAALAGTNPGGTLNRDTFLNRISGLTYGDDPKEGIVEGRKFVHPIDKFAFEAPNGFFMVNGTQAVSISGQSGKGQLTAAAYNGDLDAYVRAVFAKLAQDNKVTITPGPVQKTTVNGIPAAYSVARVAQSNNSSVDVTVFAYQMGTTNALHFMTITQAGGTGVFDSMFGSMRRISDAEAGAIKPRKLTVITAKKGDTVQSLASRMAYTDAPLDRFLVLNGLNASSKITAGQRLKLVTY